ncbi:glycoside hydrolase family 32 protein [Paenibacillus rhizovicinus]|uniref:beta-fructofuranosidase n=1 Tax=Paenibacillus rhizovicinus TaxID=2704463 RepID=A0A6C0P4A6_9BACL|nr:glycoside hydrolase family 32 protein [Paenibacillus rhizovicinus]QHW33171.1 glycoside hydrolase family 32 protein [Paenibacillus rhizovicinus]
MGQQYRPTYHFLPERNWMNDPNGTIFFEGYYHLFYQYNPYGDKWGTIHWGHARSLDLVHWEHLPIALYPSNELGEVHCFSGCAVQDGTEARIFYTSIGDGERNAATGAEQWMATSTDGLMTWTKHPGNPVLTSELHDGADVREWRDPFVWRQGEEWLMVTGGAYEGKGCVTIYKSADLEQWSFLNFLYIDPEVSLCECPLVYRQDDRYVLIYSPGGVVKYLTGKLSDTYQLIPETQGIVDHSGWEGYYAPNLLTDDRNRCILFGWMPDVARGEFTGADGWSGVQALPRVMELTASGRLAMRPVPELQRLRGQHAGRESLAAEGDRWIAGLQGRTVELLAEFDLAGAASPFGIGVLRSEDGREETRIVVDPAAKQITIDRSDSSLSPLTHKTPISGDFEAKDGRLKLHVFVDRTTVEVFCNETTCLSARIYPMQEQGAGVSLFGEAARSAMAGFDMWELTATQSE